MSSSLSPAGAVFTSCYKLNSGAATSSVVTVSGTYTLPASNSDYTFTSDASCNLDEANGETVTCILILSVLISASKSSILSKSECS